jgi:hypothetical protein
MRIAGFVITAIVVGVSSPLFAQSGTAAGTPPATQAAAANQSTPSSPSDDTRGWMASGFLGTNFGAGRNNTRLSGLENLSDNNSTSTNLGFQVGYLGRGVIGGEFLADFSPGLDTFNNALFTQAPSVNSYMFNLIAAAPFGHVGSSNPYISGGVGEISLHSTIFMVDPRVSPHSDSLTDLATEKVSGSKFGWNLGGGIMAWSEKNWGFRGDIRYYKTHGDDTNAFDINNIGDGTDFTGAALSGVSYWKGNMGIAFRF